MRLLGQIFAVLAAVALVAPASAQTYGNGMTRGGYGGPPAGAARGGYGGPMRGGGYGVVPGLLLPAIAAGAAAAAAQGEDEPPPRRRHAPPRQKIASPHPLPHSTPQKHAPKKPERKQVLAASARLDLPPKGETRLEPKEALVVFRPGVGDRQIAALARRQKLEPAQYRDIALLGRRVYRLRTFDNRPLESVLKALAREPAIASVQPNYVYALADDARPAAAAPQTPSEGAAPASYASAMLHLPEAHRVADGKGVRVALIDSAIDLKSSRNRGFGRRTIRCCRRPGQTKPPWRGHGRSHRRPQADRRRRAGRRASRRPRLRRDGRRRSRGRAGPARRIGLGGRPKGADRQYELRRPRRPVAGANAGGGRGAKDHPHRGGGQ